MSEYEKKEAFNSPMEVVFSWPTPSTGDSSNSSKRKSQDDSGYGSSKRKSQDDSGYGSPVSSKRLTIQGVSGAEGDSGFFTPRGSGRASKRLDVLYERPHTTSKMREGDAAGKYLDLDESLYSEPLGDPFTPPAEVLCTTPDVLYTPPETLSESEITKDLEGAIASCSLSPIVTPARKRALSTAYPATPRKNKSPQKRNVFSAPTVLWHPPKSRRYLDRFEYLDIVRYLGVELDVPDVMDKIIGYMSDSDLSTMTMVSKTWKKICLANSKSSKRWQSYIDERKQNRENLHVPVASTVCKQKKASLGNHDINHSTPLVARQPKSPPVSPTKARFNSILKISSSMSENEVMVMCPSCQRPYAVPKSSGVAMCTSQFCGYKFCMLCKAAYHPNRPCPLLTPSTPTTPTKLYHNKRNSRRNLRRL